MLLLRLFADAHQLLVRFHALILRILYRTKFRSVGKNVSFHYRDVITYEGISVGDDVQISPGACLLAAEAELVIGSKVRFGPNVTIITGDHPMRLQGSYIFDMMVKSPGEDLPVTIADDVWIGAGATILKGVTVGRGAVVASGALVISDVPPYAVVAGVPAKVKKYRGTPKQICDHELMLYGTTMTLPELNTEGK